MILKRYKVENFRSVLDSGWIDCDNVTTLVGINEAGKSNLLLALWKLNPAREGSIDILHDMPVSKLSNYRKTPEEVKFITAEFELDDEAIKSIESKVECNLQGDKSVKVSRFYDGSYAFEFPSGNPKSTKTEKVTKELEEGEEPIEEDIIVPIVELDLEKAILAEIPPFVYYSNYGNLSSKIYLPNVIKWLNGETVDGIDVNEEQVRTLRVLFEFVKLDPKEILELGQDPKEMAMLRNGRNGNTQPTSEEIKQAENDKEERSILLQSASGDLTKKFREWWKQGEYKFRFEADGDYFRIWVSDSIRTDEVALELRSTGLQWFISFYLIFLVESQEQHKGAILLLDEAGLTLHPLAQKDLALFFDNLSKGNQIINTTYSPFIVDTSNIDRCRVVFMDKDGYTVASSNLRQGSDALNEKSIYAVHAALGLSVSDVLLQGCQAIVVEGPSDQFYLNAIKGFLIREKLIAPEQEIVFVPSGGVKGVPGVVSMISSKADDIPYLIIDSDKSGEDAKKRLLSGLYQGVENRILDVKDYTAIEKSEVEDLIPFSLIKKGVDRLFNSLDEVDFEENYNKEIPVVSQIETFADSNGIELEKGWKVGISMAAKAQLKSKKAGAIPQEYIDKWTNLFNAFLSV
ncbi:AAA family ATPase [Myroides sp. 1354]|uniref:AAA family ATPase n=1 Tax=unclassified Myroides TaxID=2642485 RepID=UPI002575AE2D|nr:MULTISPECIES: AAA family ATPase [unclassified Myroides]MDM1046603.1 AAA family ATPase [Myroides sp. R163-1]MDM1057554.1 AAA family ATPase [Myroides sp. 1354]MDM1070844.1 AAA family ATPase [Myroides sp. 1372]